MVCSICKHQLVKKIKTKHGCICPDCYGRLPDSVKNSIRSFTPRQLTELSQICHEHTELARLRVNNLVVCDHSLQINNWEINIEDIENISMNFHPVRQGEAADVCCGYVSAVVETKNPHCLIEEPIADHEIVVRYYINGKNINYVYKQDVSQILMDIQSAIRNKEGSFIKTILSFSKRKQKENQSSNKTGGQDSSTKSASTGRSKTTRSPFAEARRMYGVEIPYTKQTLDQRKRILLQQWHPDHNMGNEALAQEMTTLILRNYELLLKQADA